MFWFNLIQFIEKLPFAHRGERVQGLEKNIHILNINKFLDS